VAGGPFVAVRHASPARIIGAFRTRKIANQNREQSSKIADNRNCPVALRTALRYFDVSNQEISMSNHSEVAYSIADGNDYQAHEDTYEGFIKFAKYGTAIVVAIVSLMAIFLT
jgi:Bacterial aa3 type cytochrome c oxidase subunit IV